MDSRLLPGYLPCFNCQKLVNMTSSLTFQFCVCNKIFCSSECYENHKHDELVLNSMVTLLSCATCGKCTDITQEPSEFRYCYCSNVSCSHACLEKGKDFHSQHWYKADGFPCKARPFKTEKNRDLWLEDRTEICGHCENESITLPYFCEECKLFFCGKDLEKNGNPISCFDAHDCVLDN